MSFALIRLWISSFPSLSPIPLIFHVSIRISFNLIHVVSRDVIFLSAGTARSQVSRSATYLWAILHCFTCLLIALANASRPVSEKCNPSLPKCDRKRLSKLMTCILLDFVQMCLMKILIFSTLLFSDTSSNLIGNSLIMTWALLFSVCASRTSALIRWIHVATSSCGTLFVPPKRTMTSSSLDIIPDKHFWMPSAFDPGHGTQHAEMPLVLSDTSTPWPRTMDAPIILTLVRLTPFPLPFFLPTALVFCLTHFFWGLDIRSWLSLLVHSWASTENRLLVSTFGTTKSHSFWCLTVLRSLWIRFLFSSTSLRSAPTTFFTDAWESGMSFKVSSISPLFETVISLSISLRSKSITIVLKVSISFCTKPTACVALLAAGDMTVSGQPTAGAGVLFPSWAVARGGVAILRMSSKVPLDSMESVLISAAGSSVDAGLGGRLSGGDGNISLSGTAAAGGLSRPEGPPCPRVAGNASASVSFTTFDSSFNWYCILSTVHLRSSMARPWSQHCMPLWCARPPGVRSSTLLLGL